MMFHGWYVFVIQLSASNELHTIRFFSNLDGLNLFSLLMQLVAHSVGTWISFEFLQACRGAGVPLPKLAFLSGMASPDIPFEERPWRQQKNLNEEEFKDECREWDISEVVFSAGMWPMYQPLLRADFTIFDEYEYTHQGKLGT